MTKITPKLSVPRGTPRLAGQRWVGIGWETRRKGSRPGKMGLRASLGIWLLFLKYSLNGGWIGRRSNPKQTITSSSALGFQLGNGL